MLREILKSKVYYAKVTQTELYYEGSITIDEDIVEEAGLIAGEKVEVLNLNNGSRLQTYVIKGKKGSGAICLNGPAARMGLVGDRIIILSYGILAEDETRGHKVRYVLLDDKNRIKETALR